jgi:hypothetical protein
VKLPMDVASQRRAISTRKMATLLRGQQKTEQFPIMVECPVQGSSESPKEAEKQV